MDIWFSRFMDNHGKFACGVLAIVAIIGFVFFGPTNNTDNTKMYEDEMIVSIDDYKVLQDKVKTLEKDVSLLFAGEPQSPESMMRVDMFVCMQNTEDYKDGFLEVNTILTCMNLEFPKEK